MATGCKYEISRYLCDGSSHIPVAVARTAVVVRVSVASIVLRNRAVVANVVMAVVSVVRGRRRRQRCGEAGRKRHCADRQRPEDRVLDHR